jgi:GcrA cell cycle regulator
MEMKWSTDETSELVRQWPFRSASQLAGAFGRTRTAICGKVHRLCQAGVLKRLVVKHYEVEPRHPPPPGRKTPQVPRPPRPSEIKRAVIRYTREPILTMRPCCLTELDEHRCHWPLDIKSPEPATDFCGGTAVPGLPYCAHHHYRSTQHGEYRHERTRHY